MEHDDFVARSGESPGYFHVVTDDRSQRIALRYSGVLIIRRLLLQAKRVSAERFCNGRRRDSAVDWFRRTWACSAWKT